MFKLGQVVVTNGVSNLMNKGTSLFKLFVQDSLEQHAKGDWGDLCKEDKELNDSALNENEPERILSSYTDKNGVKIWIITEWDRSVTTVLLPEEY